MKNNKIERSILSILVAGFLVSAMAYSQDDIPVTRGADPGSDEALADAEGWVHVFDGTWEMLLRNWYINEERHCKSGDICGYWYISEHLGEPVLASDQVDGVHGGLLQTNRRYGNVRVKTRMQPSWGGDGGIFMRTAQSGRSLQVVIDYHKSGRIGGFYDEGAGTGQSKEQLYSFESPLDVVNEGWDVLNNENWSDFWVYPGFNIIEAQITGEKTSPYLQAWINGRQSLDLEISDPEKLDADGKGGVALQIHGGEDKWGDEPSYYSDVWIMELCKEGNDYVPCYKNEPVPVVILTQPQALIDVELGSPANLTVGLASTDGMTFQWQKNGVDITGANAAAYSILAATAADAGTYTVVISNGVESVTSSGSQVNVVPVSINQITSGGNSLFWQTGNGLEITGNTLSRHEIKVLDVTGRVMETFTGGQGKINYSMPGLKEGVYFLQVNAGGQTQVHKVTCISSM